MPKAVTSQIAGINGELLVEDGFASGLEKLQDVARAEKEKRLSFRSHPFFRGMGIYLDAANKHEAVRCDRNSGHPVIHPNFPKSILQTFANYLVHSMLHIMHHGKDWATMSASAG